MWNCFACVFGDLPNYLPNVQAWHACSLITLLSGVPGPIPVTARTRLAPTTAAAASMVVQTGMRADDVVGRVGQMQFQTIQWPLRRWPRVGGAGETRSRLTPDQTTRNRSTIPGNPSPQEKKKCVETWSTFCLGWFIYFFTNSYFGVFAGVSQRVVRVVTQQKTYHCGYHRLGSFSTSFSCAPCLSFFTSSWTTWVSGFYP